MTRASPIADSSGLFCRATVPPSCGNARASDGRNVCACQWRERSSTISACLGVHQSSLWSAFIRSLTIEVSDGDEPPLTLEFTLSATAHPGSLHRICWAVVHSVMCSLSHAFLAATQRGQ